MFKKIIAIFLSLNFILAQSGFCQGVAELNLGQYLGQMDSGLKPDRFRPPHLRYFSYDVANDNFQLLLDKGDNQDIKDKDLEDKTKVLMEYFQIGLALPNDKFWVNLRPDAQDQIIDPELERTDLGKVMLESDLQLKKDTANFTSPQTPEGRAYWDKLYQKARELFGSEPANIPTITRPWIVPGEIILRQGEGSAYIFKANMKVMLEEDYLSSQPSAISSQQYNFKDPRMKELNTYSTQLIRELIIPQLTKEVNTSKRYASLRQVFFSLVLARWFKERFKGLSPKGTVPFLKLIDSGDLTNLTSKESWSKSYYFNEYKKSFEKGEYNLKEQINTPTGQVIRSYMSGGTDFTGTSSPVIKDTYKAGVFYLQYGIESLPWELLPGVSIFGNGLNSPHLPDLLTGSGFIIDNAIDNAITVFGQYYWKDVKAARIVRELRNSVYPIFSAPIHIYTDDVTKEREASTFRAFFGSGRIRNILLNGVRGEMPSVYDWIKKTNTLGRLFRSNILNPSEEDLRDRINSAFVKAKNQLDALAGSSPLTVDDEKKDVGRTISNFNQSFAEIETSFNSLIPEDDRYRDFIARAKIRFSKVRGIVKNNQDEINRISLLEELGRGKAFADYGGIGNFIVALKNEHSMWNLEIDRYGFEPDKTLTKIREIAREGNKKVEEFYIELEKIQWGVERSKASGSRVIAHPGGPLEKARGGEDTLLGGIAPPTGKASSSLNQVGGIDFRAMEMLIQPMGSFHNLNLSLPTLSSSALERIDLDKELAALRQMASSGIVPSAERVKEYLAACFQKGRMPEKQDELFVSLVEIYRLLEDEVKEASSSLKEALVIVDTGRFVLLPNSQKSGLN